MAINLQKIRLLIIEKINRFHELKNFKTKRHSYFISNHFNFKQKAKNHDKKIYQSEN